MTRLAIRALFACAALSALALALLAIPDGSGLPVRDREPHVVLEVLLAIVCAHLALTVVRIVAKQLQEDDYVD